MTPGSKKDSARGQRPLEELRSDAACVSLVRVSGTPAVPATEVFLHARPASGVATTAEQVEAVYSAMLDALALPADTGAIILDEKVFLARPDQDFRGLLAARSSALGTEHPTGSAASLMVIGQAPVDSASRLELSARILIPPSSSCVTSAEHCAELICDCSACASGARARELSTGAVRELYAANIVGHGSDPLQEAYNMFCVAGQLLESAGMGFRDVVRTWIHVRDIGRDYDALNRARRRYFEEHGVDLKPASTGVQGAPCSPKHNLALTFEAVSGSGADLEVSAISGDTLNEAWSYGADFSRGLRIVKPGSTTLQISGTASIGEAGETVAPGALEPQVDRMLTNIESLLVSESACSNDIVSAITYLDDPADASRVRAIFDDRGFSGFPSVMVEAKLCRPDLVCETELVALAGGACGDS